MCIRDRFDGSIGANSVFMPFGGKYQLTPAQVMAATMPALSGQCETASVMAFGFDPYYTERNPFLGASAAVIESVAKLVAAGCDFETAYLTFQEYFERLGKDPKRFGKPLSALLGAYNAQEELCLGAIGGKDSMSGSFDDMDVPPTLVSFAIAPQDASRLISPEFKAAGHPVYFFDAPYFQDGSPDYQTMKHVWNEVANLIAAGKAVSAWALSCLLYTSLHLAGNQRVVVQHHAVRIEQRGIRPNHLHIVRHHIRSRKMAFGIFQIVFDRQIMQLPGKPVRAMKRLSADRGARADARPPQINAYQCFGRLLSPAAAADRHQIHIPFDRHGQAEVMFQMRLQAHAPQLRMADRAGRHAILQRAVIAHCSSRKLRVTRFHTHRQRVYIVQDTVCAFGLLPVSYTHLDVYKRQAIGTSVGQPLPITSSRSLTSMNGRLCSCSGAATRAAKRA